MLQASALQGGPSQARGKRLRLSEKGAYSGQFLMDSQNAIAEGCAPLQRATERYLNGWQGCHRPGGENGTSAAQIDFLHVRAGVPTVP